MLTFLKGHEFSVSITGISGHDPSSLESTEISSENSALPYIMRISLQDNQEWGKTHGEHHG